MADASRTPDNESRPDRVSDAVAGNWVDNLAPDWSRPYLRLSRADRPIGSWLLLLPCWWGLFLAMASNPSSISWEDAWIFSGCAIGAVLMRGAGCTWNDITDRKLDAKVARTRSRPLPSGQVSTAMALFWMTVQALAALAILLTFNASAIALGLISLVPVAVYPFAKRFTWWPQIFLGIAFNWGALLAWVAHTGTLNAPAILLYVSGIFWTLFYDTIYAHLDSHDDALVGVKSTARLFGDSSKRWLFGFAVISPILMMAAVVASMDPMETPVRFAGAFAGVALFGSHLYWQLWALNPLDNRNCLKLFRSNRNAGLLPIAGFLLAGIL